jgi:hypothetical protein
MKSSRASGLRERRARRELHPKTKLEGKLDNDEVFLSDDGFYKI